MNPYQNPNQNNLLLRSTVDRTNTEVNQKQNKTKSNVVSAKFETRDFSRPASELFAPCLRKLKNGQLQAQKQVRSKGRLKV